MQIDTQLLASLSEDVRQVLIRISALTDSASDMHELKADVSEQAALALSLLEDSTMCSMLLTGQLKLELEPVQLGSVLVSTLHQLYPLSKAHNCTIEFVKEGYLRPAYSDRRFVEIASRSLLRSLIESSSTQRTVKLSAYQSGNNTVFSIGDSSLDLSSVNISSLRSNKRFSAQPFPQISAGPLHGMYVAIAVLSELGTRLRIVSRKGSKELAATFTTTSQLALL
jgi:hypothetical protein